MKQRWLPKPIFGNASMTSLKLVCAMVVGLILFDQITSFSLIIASYRGLDLLDRIKLYFVFMAAPLSDGANDHKTLCIKESAQESLQEHNFSVQQGA